MSDKKDEETFVEGASSGCRNCRNFGHASCPTFQAGVGQGLNPEALKSAIARDQKKRDLIACKNV